MAIKVSRDIENIVNKNPGKPAQRRTPDYQNVTSARLMALYPTAQWQSRFVQTVYGGRRN